MNIDEIRKLAELLTAHGLTKLEVEDGGVIVRMEKVLSVSPQAAASAQPPTVSENTNISDENNDKFNFANLYEVKSPLVGVFYAGPSPEAEPFVHIGSKVGKGDVLCIVEAMKLMNKITAERDGEIADVCIKDGEIAEYGQVLFKML